MPNKNQLMIERGYRLQSIRKKVGLTRLEFAQKTGVSPNTLKSIELGERELTQQKALLFSNLFTSLFAVSLGADAHEASFDYLYHGKVQNDLEEKGAILDDERIQTVINAFATNSAYTVFKIPDNSMAPFYNIGDVVCGRKIANKSHFTYLQGQVCILENANGEKHLRRIIKIDGHKITAYILNTNSTLNAQLVEEMIVASMAQATWHWHLSELVQNS